MFRYLSSAIFFSLLLFGLTISKANAKGLPIVYTFGDTISHVEKIPEEVVPAQNGEPSILGWKHSLYSIFWIPLAGSSSGEYVIYNETPSGKSYYTLTPEQLTQLSSAMGNEYKAETSPISWFSLFWGWLIVIPVIGYYIMPKSNDDETDETAAS